MKELKKEGLRQFDGNIDHLIQFFADAINEKANDMIGYAHDIQNKWQTPEETIRREWGDCKDIAMLKYFMLRSLGVPDEKLSFVYTKTSQREAHMILQINGDYFLDNIHRGLLPKDSYVPIVSFNNEESRNASGKTTRKYHGRNTIIAQILKKSGIG